MPSLHEYIRTLRTYNPGITNRTIIIYLLKNGWRQEEVEQAIKELDSTPISQTESNITVQSENGPITFGAPKQIIGTPKTDTVPTHLTALEVQPEELETAPVQESLKKEDPIKESPAVPPAIHHMNLQEIMDKAIAEREKATATPAPISTSTPTPASAPTQTQVSSPASTTPATATAAPAYAMPSIPSQSVNPAVSSDFGEPVMVNRPKFSYQDIMEGHGPVMPASNPSPVSAPVVSDMQGQVPAGSPQTPMRNVVMPSSQAPQTASANLGLGGSVGADPLPTMSGVGGGANTNDTTPRKSVAGKLIKWFIFIIVIALLVFGYITQVHGVYIFAKAPFEKNELFAGVIQKMDTIHSSAFQSTTTIEFLPYTNGNINTSVGQYASSTGDTSAGQQLAELFPADGKIYFTINGANEIINNPIDSTGSATDVGTTSADKNLSDLARATAHLKSQLSVEGGYQASGVQLKGSADLVYTPEGFFIRIKELPSFLNQFSQYKGAWIAYRPESFEEIKKLTRSEESEVVSDDMINYEEDMANGPAYQEVFEDAFNQGLVTISEPISVRGDDYKVLFKYEVRGDVSKSEVFLNKYKNGSMNTPEDIAVVNLAESLVSIFKNLKIDIYVDSKGVLHRIDLELVLDAPETFPTIGAKLNSSVYFDRFNMQQNIVAPTDYIDSTELLNNVMQGEQGVPVESQNKI